VSRIRIQGHCEFYSNCGTLPKCFHVSEVYLKKEERIESLSMIMVLSLLIYSFAEWRLREKLRETGQSIPNQLTILALLGKECKNYYGMD